MSDTASLYLTLHVPPDEMVKYIQDLMTLPHGEIAASSAMTLAQRQWGGDIKLTEDGMAFAHAAVDERKRIFMRHLLSYVPLAAHVRRVLDERASHSARKSRFIDELEDFMSEEAADQTLRAVVRWARYAEAFAYDDENAMFSLENPT